MLPRCLNCNPSSMRVNLASLRYSYNGKAEEIEAVNITAIGELRD
jgi:hypothetical protein